VSMVLYESADDKGAGCCSLLANRAPEGPATGLEKLNSKVGWNLGWNLRMLGDCLGDFRGFDFHLSCHIAAKVVGEESLGVVPSLASGQLAANEALNVPTVIVDVLSVQMKRERIEDFSLELCVVFVHALYVHIMYTRSNRKRTGYTKNLETSHRQG